VGLLLGVAFGAKWFLEGNFLQPVRCSPPTSHPPPPCTPPPPPRPALSYPFTCRGGATSSTRRPAASTCSRRSARGT
jgi:hypothetical protein